jgi:hypothetical protein
VRVRDLYAYDLMLHTRKNRFRRYQGLGQRFWPCEVDQEYMLLEGRVDGQ